MSQRLVAVTYSIALLVVLVLHNENHVEPRQNRRLEINVLPRTPPLVVPPPDRVRRRQHTRPRVEHGRDARLRDRDRLLLHNFVDRCTV